MRIKLIVNPTAGRQKARKYLPRIEKLLGKEHIIETTCTTKREDISACARESSINNKYDVIVACGGDGTLNGVINGIMQGNTSTPVGFIPLGTENVFGWQAGIPRNPLDACQLISSGNRTRIDLGKIYTNAVSYFILMAGIGFDAKVVHDVKPPLKNLIGNLSYPLMGLLNLLTYNPSKLFIQYNEGKTVHECYFAVVGNSKVYGGQYKVTPYADIQDGMLDVCLFKKRSRYNLLSHILHIITKKQLRTDSHDIEYIKAGKINISASEKTWIQIDGELLGELPCKIEIVPGAIQMVLAKN